MRSDDVVCATCAYFDADRSESAYLGKCRARPPIPLLRADDKIRAMWPIVHHREWCGLYRPAATGGRASAE